MQLCRCLDLELASVTHLVCTASLTLRTLGYGKTFSNWDAHSGGQKECGVLYYQKQMLQRLEELWLLMMTTVSNCYHRLLPICLESQHEPICRQASVQYYCWADVCHRRDITYIFYAKQAAVYVFITTRILRTRTLSYVTTPAIHFRSWVTTLIWLSSGSIYLRARTHVAIWLPNNRLVLWLSLGVLLELVAQKEQRKRREKESYQQRYVLQTHLCFCLQFAI